MLDAEPEKARRMMRKILDGRLVFEPDPAATIYRFIGRASYGRLLETLLDGLHVWGEYGTRSAYWNCLAWSGKQTCGLELAERRLAGRLEGMRGRNTTRRRSP